MPTSLNKFRHVQTCLSGGFNGSRSSCRGSFRSSRDGSGWGWGRLGWPFDFQRLQGTNSLTIFGLNTLHSFLLPQSDGHKDALKGFGLKHHILDKVVGQLSDVDATNTLGKLGLDLLNLILQRPQLHDASFQNLAMVRLFFSQGNEVRFHFCLDGLDNDTTFLLDVSMVPVQFGQDQVPFL